jgi:acetyl-CoA carboxylase biotin carboxyl carrier protein
MTDKTHDADVAFISALAELLRANELSELQVKRDYGDEGSLNVRVSRQMNQVVTQVSAASPQAAPSPEPKPSETPAGSGDPAEHPGAVTSPMVGTVYMQPEPGSAPFIHVGMQVSEGDTLLIVEAMKTMNHIPAPRSGKISRILVEDGAAVEYGAPLVILE